jgi:hypothetical protein
MHHNTQNAIQLLTQDVTPGYSLAPSSAGAVLHLTIFFLQVTGYSNYRADRIAMCSCDSMPR